MADTLLDLFPDPDELIKLPVEDLAPVVLRLAQSELQNGRIHPERIFQQIDLTIGDPSKQGYPHPKKPAARAALNTAWHSLVQQGLLVPEAGENGRNGYHNLTPAGAAIASDAHFESFKRAKEFPKSLIHPAIADRASLNLARGDYDTAVFESLRAVEEAVRAAGQYTLADYGVGLMRKAFSPNTGPLTDKTAPAARAAGVL